MRLCTGPGHDEPIWLPATEKYFHQHKSGQRKGKMASRCRLCQNWNKLQSPGESGWIAASKVRSFFIEGVHRVGMMEFCRRAKINPGAVRKIIDGSTQHVQKRTTRKAMLEVISMRRKGEVRHRNSIRVGAHLRGWEEKEIKSWRDYYKPNGDTEMQRGRRRRNAA